MRRHYPLQGIPLLLVEDEMLQAVDIIDVLEDLGAIVVGPAKTVDEAFELLRTQHCRAAVLDFCLGKQKITPLAMALYHQRMPFVVYTGYSDMSDLPNGWSGCQVVFKPDTDQLIDTLALLTRKERTPCYSQEHHAN